MKPSRLCVLGAVLAAAGTFIATAHAEVKTQIVEYKQGDAVGDGYLAYDDSIQGKRPAVLLVHPREGMTAFVEGRAQALAKLGYVAFAADIFGKGVRPKTVPEMQEQSALYNKNRPLARSRILAAYDVIKQNPMVDPTRVAVIGFCFGGMPTLELARSGAPIKAAVTFHGTLFTPTPEDTKNIKGRVLILHGADDPTVKLEQVNTVVQELREAKIPFDLELYGGVVHNFTNPLAKASYNAHADKRSWAAMQELFSDVFKD